ncbi:hypothetical protein [Candidatus Lokiarchaeum ossiferum]|uniref:hypothetical protein n=1 Tax=Candidatus Lokiarchaeum ossiferum TaxID=2951803 RepID=UPI00352C6F0F
MSKPIELNNLYDFYVIRLNGLPIFAGCSGTDYCQGHVAQHQLHAGFFSALYAFANEAFQDVRLETIYFDKIQMNLLISESDNIMIIFVHHRSKSLQKIRELMNQTWEIFKQDYIPKLKENQFQKDLYKAFLEDLKRLKVILPDKDPFDIREMLLEGLKNRKIPAQ